MDTQLRGVTSRKICSSVMLQQLLFYNIYCSGAWLVFMFIRTLQKYSRGLSIQDPDIVRTVLVASWVAIEPFRLLSGYYGNLQENAPWLVIFGVLTLAPGTIAPYYLMLAAKDIQAVDKAVQVAMAGLLHLELLVLIYAVRRMSTMQRQQFYLFEYALRQQQEQRRLQQRQEQLQQSSVPWRDGT